MLQLQPCSIRKNELSKLTDFFAVDEKFADLVGRKSGLSGTLLRHDRSVDELELEQIEANNLEGGLPEARHEPSRNSRDILSNICCYDVIERVTVSPNSKVL